MAQLSRKDMVVLLIVDSLAPIGGESAEVLIDDAQMFETPEERKERGIVVAKEEAKLAVDIPIERSGSKIIIPEDLDYDDAMSALRRRKAQEEQDTQIHHIFEMTPAEGALALVRSLQDLHGFVNPRSTPTFFGPKPPVFWAMEISATESESVPWGRLEVPGISGYVEPSIHWANGVPKFMLGGVVKGKSKREVDRLVKHIRSRKDSIYKGKAIRVSFPKQSEMDGEDSSSIEDFFPRFMSLPKVSEKDLVFSEDIDMVVKTTLFTPIECSDMCREDATPLKRGILLEGPFGVGKSLTASVTALKCIANGWTFIYLENVKNFAEALEFAKAYQPAVIFAEDLDVALNDPKKRDADVNAILNAIDGIGSKNIEIMSVFTTNKVEVITQAMLRPGRIDTVIPVRAPNAEAVQKLIRLFAGDRLDANEDLSKPAAILDGKIPAMIREVVERSKLGSIYRAKRDGLLVRRINAEDLTTAAISMTKHNDLLKTPEPDGRSDIEKGASILADALVPKRTNGHAERHLQQGGASV